MSLPVPRVGTFIKQAVQLLRRERERERSYSFLSMAECVAYYGICRMRVARLPIFWRQKMKESEAMTRIMRSLTGLRASKLAAFAVSSVLMASVGTLGRAQVSTASLNGTVQD